MNKFTVVPFDKNQQRKQFDCGIDELNKYLYQNISQDVKRNIATAFVVLDNNKIIGFYTLSASSINTGDLPEILKNKCPKYPLVPVALLGRLAVDVHYQKQGLGDLLLMDALKRSLRSSEQIAIMSVAVDAINQSAINFYQNYGFDKLSGNRLFLPIKTIARLG